MSDTVARILAEALNASPQTGALPPIAPLFGQQLPDPSQLAALWSQLPAWDPRRQFLGSAYGLRQVPWEALTGRIASYTPAALPYYGRPIGYG